MMKKYVVLFGLMIGLFSSDVKAQTDGGTKVIVDNNKLRVTQYYSLPGKDVCGKGQHSHPAHLTVILTGGTVTITNVHGKVITQQAPAGATFWSPAETHEVVNSGKLPMKILIIETKK